ncbi:hypothetical protein CEXT_150041 [Caerostris extrusa]|uniref:Maturase K n=1 Tax=Caerostris extrusa TaxID=172846 RepID=A0AAV4T5X6_CAEEX|nr:hypothetical protein CEXT_150041 [Caerostris extrusa]
MSTGDNGKKIQYVRQELAHYWLSHSQYFKGFLPAREVSDVVCLVDNGHYEFLSHGHISSTLSNYHIVTKVLADSE